MTIYLGGSSKDKNVCREVMNLLAEEGFSVLAPWLNWTKESHPDEQQNWHALLDCIHRSAAMVYVAPPADIFSAGATFEAGYALGIHRPVYLFRPAHRQIPDSVYHWGYTGNCYRVGGMSLLLESLAWAKGY